MAAATQVPAATWASKTWAQELLDNINKAVSLGIFATSDLVSAAKTNLQTEIDAR